MALPERSEQTGKMKCERGTDRDMLTERADLRAARSGGVYLVSLYDPHVWMPGTRERAHARIWLPSLVSHHRGQAPLFDR